MPLFKVLHLVAAFAWFAGLLYLPRLFVYHAGCDDDIGKARFCQMESRLYWRIMLPAMVAVWLFGLLLVATAPRGWWVVGKMALALLLVGYHLYCGFVIRAFARGRVPHSARFFRFFNEVPALVLIALVALAVYKPL